MKIVVRCKRLQMINDPSYILLLESVLQVHAVVDPLVDKYNFLYVKRKEGMGWDGNHE